MQNTIRQLKFYDFLRLTSIVLFIATVLQIDAYNGFFH